MEELPVIVQNFAEGSNGTKVSRDAIICGLKNISIKEKGVIFQQSILRADLAPLRIGSHCILQEKCVLHPCYSLKRIGDEPITFLPLLIGDYVYIGKESVIQASSIGSFVHVGENCIIGPRCILKNNCKIEDNSVLPPDTIVPSFSVFKGNPAQCIDALPESFEVMQKNFIESFYSKIIKSF